MFHGRKGLRVTGRWILLAAMALLLSGVGLLVVPGAGADKITQTNGCGVGKDASVNSHETDGNGDQNGNGDKTGTGNGDDKSKCGDTDGNGNGNDGDGDDNGGGNGCQSDSSVVHSDTIDASGDSADCDGKGEGNDNDSDDACVTTVQNDCDGGGNGNDNDGDDVGGTTGPTGATGETGETTTITTATSGVTTTAPSGVQQIKGASSSKGKAKACTSRRLFVIRVRHPHGQYLVAANVTVNGKRVATMRGNRISSTIKLVGLPKGTVKVHIRAVTNKGKVLHGVRTYHTCVAGHHGSVPKL
jgi:hypothetical protein